MLVLEIRRIAGVTPKGHPEKEVTMFRILSLTTLFVLCAGASASQSNQPQRTEETLLCEVVELEADGTEYGVFVDPKTAPVVARAQVSHEIDVNDGLISSDEASAVINATFEQSETASQAPRVFAPTPKTRAYETRQQLFYMSNPNTKGAVPATSEVKESE